MNKPSVITRAANVMHRVTVFFPPFFSTDAIAKYAGIKTHIDARTWWFNAEPRYTYVQPNKSSRPVVQECPSCCSGIIEYSADCKEQDPDTAKHLQGLPRPLVFHHTSDDNTGQTKCDQRVKAKYNKCQHTLE